MKPLKVKPKIMIVALDATEDYSPEVVEKCGKIADVYYYNANKVTHCCEFTPSYWLEYVTSYASNTYAEKSSEDKLEQKKIYDILEYANLFTPEGMYVHCHQLDNHPRVKLLDDFSDYDEEDYSDNLDEFVREKCRPDEFLCEDFLPF